MQNPFDQKKQSILKEISANELTPDASPKGTIDEMCIPIIDLINSNKDMVTTSSCSGRVSVFLEGVKDILDVNDVQIGAKGNYGHWLFVTHDPKSLPNWYKSIDFKYDTDEQLKLSSMIDQKSRFILFKFEPLILHVKCRDLQMANALYTSAMGCGFRETGIGSNNIVGIRISIKLDVPIGYLNKSTTGEELISFVTQDYLQIITQLSEDRFKENFKKLDSLYKAIEQLNSKAVSSSATTEKQESKEDRKQRKMAEGLARREAVRAEKELKKLQKLAQQQQHPDGPENPSQ
ncbi:hypothetical protein QCA50_015742 [Cerrena zonata]|uniref:tRNA wybutosine-synthesizing protein 3 n=1 Tax=Cerrena zonata TaxID=2478898 RepID=A0AAW0FLT7_9APHY